MLNRREINTALETENYRIEYDCDCSGVRCNIRRGLGIEFEADEAWTSSTLIIGKEAICQVSDLNGFELEKKYLWIEEEEDDEEEYDDYDDYYDYLVDRLFDATPDAPEENEALENAKFSELKSELEEIVKNGGKLYRDDFRGFANEYKLIVDLDGNSEPEDDWQEISPTEFAEDYLRESDALTEMHVYLDVI